MAQTTSRLGLYLPGGGSTGTNTPDEAADIDKINDNMSKIDAAAGATVCTSGTRPSSPYNGRLIFETDTKYVRVWNAATSNWDFIGGNTIPVANGGTGGTAVADAQNNLGIGLIPLITQSFSSSGAISIDNIFSSTYDHYRLILKINGASATQELRVKGRTSGGDANGAWYTGLLGSNYNGATEYATTVNTQYGYIGATTNPQGGRVFSIVDILGPNTNQVTQLSINAFKPDTGLIGYSMELVTTPYTGLTVYPSTGTISGTISIYAYKKA